MEFIDNWGPSQRFKDERLYQVELAGDLRHRFPGGDVKTEVNVAGGRIDVEVMGVGVELKVPSKAQLQRLVGQARMYRKHYGPNLVLVIFNDFAKVQDINEFRNDLVELGIRVFVK
jgi:hypothetical protein